jgi:hypothetical protein
VGLSERSSRLRHSLWHNIASEVVDRIKKKLAEESVSGARQPSTAFTLAIRT